MSMSDETRPMAPTPPSEPPPPPTPGRGDPHRRRLLLIGGAAIAGVALLVVAFFVGQSTGSTTQSGPTSLGAALTAARTGTLPCGTSNDVTRRVLDRLCGGTASGGGSGATGGAGAGGGRALMVGTIQSVTGSQVTVQTGQGLVTLTIGSGAAVRTLVEGSASDLTSGARVLLTGGQQANGVRQIVVLGAGRGGGTAAGGAGTTTPPAS